MKNEMLQIGRLSGCWSKFKTWGWRGVRDALMRAYAAHMNRRRVLELIAKPSRHEREKGVTIIAELTGRHSLSKVMRDLIVMLRKSGIAYQTWDTQLKPDIPKSDYETILTPKEDFDFHRYTHTIEVYRSILPDGLGVKKCRVVFHDSAAGILEAMPFLDTSDTILAMSDFNFEYFKTALKRSHVFKIVYPLLLPDCERTPRDEVRAKYGIGKDDFVVFFNFDFGSYYRKNPTASMRAFAKAFADVPTAKLVFKTKGAAACPEHARELDRVAGELGIADKFIHLSAYLPRKDLDGLTDACDVYLSLHRSEGFGLGIAEAMSLGHPAIVTDWSATTEFCKPGNSLPIPYKLVPIRPGEYIECLKEWAEADVDAAAAALRKLYDDPALRAELGRKAKAFIGEYFNVANFKRSMEVFLDV